MPLDGVARAAGADRGAAVQDAARDRRPEPALAHGRRDHQRRRLRPGLVRRAARARASTTASRRPGATRTCASSPRTSSRRCSSRTCAPRSARRCSRPTATRSATAAGCSCTTATSRGFHDVCGATSCWRSTRSCFADDPRLDRHRGRLPPRADASGSRTTRSARSSARSADRGDGARRTGSPDAVQATFGVSDGESLWAVRYATEGTPRSLFASADVDTIRACTRTTRASQRLSADDRADRLRAVLRPARRVAGDPGEARRSRCARRRAVESPFQPRPVDARALAGAADA